MEHDKEIDCIKGIAIVMVIVFHSIISYSLQVFSILHIEQAVPLFLIITAYLTFYRIKINGSKGYYAPSNIIKLIKRIFIPYFIFQLLIISVSVLKKDFNWISSILNGGNGMGSYYPWLYFQYWLLLPLIYTLLTKNIKWGGVILIVVSAIIELIFSFLSTATVNNNIFDQIWRLFVGRYIFIGYIAYLLLEIKVVKKYYYILVLLSFIFCIVHRYQLIDLSPWFYKTKSFAWNGVHWPMYFYTGAVFLILQKNLLLLPPVFKNILEWFGKNSWEIFLSQMLYFTIFSLNDMPTSNKLIEIMIFIVLGICFCIFTVLFYNKLKFSLQRIK